MEDTVSTSMEEVKSILNNVLLALQLSLGLWQIIKFTPVGAIVQGVMALLLRPLGLFTDYARLQHCRGKLFKRNVYCGITTENLPNWLRNADVKAICEQRREVSPCYLGDDYTLRVRVDDSLWTMEVESCNGKICYNITPKIWLQILVMMDELNQARRLAFLEAAGIKGFREIWEGVATGGVMNFSEVLDSVILDNMYFISSDSTFLLPVNLSVSEEKVLKFLNMVGLFLQKKKLHWLFPFLFSLTSAVLEFSAPLRIWLYGKINVLFCSAVRLICDKLSYPMRREVYSLGNWVDKLQPSNDFELRVVRGDRCVPLAGGAKLVNQNGATLLPHPYSFSGEEQEGLFSEEEPEGIPFRMTRTKLFRSRHFDIGCQYRPLDNPEGSGIAYITDYPHNPNAPHNPERHIFILQVECNRDEYIKMCTLVSCMAKNRSGSLKLYDPNNKLVQVYGMKESIIHYAKSGFPPIYEIQFKDVILT